VTGTGAVAGGDLGRDEPKSCTLDLLDEALGVTQRLAAPAVRLGRTEVSGLPVIDTAPAPGASSDGRGRTR
jgi:hypothetical protein